MNNRTLKAFVPVVLLTFLLDTPAAFAIKGGPFDGGYQPGATANGTYSGVVIGKNLTGIVQFGINDGGGVNGDGTFAVPFSRFSVFHEGILGTGTVAAIADIANQQIAGTLDGSSDPIQNTFLDPSTNTAILVDANGVQNINFPDDTAFGSPGFTAEGAFTAEMKGYPIQITFEGKGEYSSVANPVTTTPIAVGDAITITGAGTADNGRAVGSPQVVETVAPTDTRIGSTALRSTTPFEIRGSRTALGFAQ